MNWIIVKGVTKDGKQKEYQVSDGEIGQRTSSYDFKDLQKAKTLCKQLNKGGK